MADVMSDYSEDFEEDESDIKSAAKPSLEALTPRKIMSDVKRVAKSNRLPPKPKQKFGLKVRAFSEARQLDSRWQDSSPRRDRVLSAKGHTIKALQSALAEARKELEEAKKDNRLLKRMQIRQERELNRFQTHEGELPQILLRHSEEMRVVKEQLKRSQEAVAAHQSKEVTLREELLRLNDRKRKLEEVVRKKHLLERATLTTQLKEAKETLNERDQRIAELQRSIEVIGRNHTSEMRSLMMKHKALSTEAETLRESSKKMKTHLRDKEKEMEVMNIYSQRIARPSLPRKPLPPSLLDGTSQTDLTCPPAKVVSLQTKPTLKSTSSQTQLPEPHPAKTMLPVATQTETAPRTLPANATVIPTATKNPPTTANTPPPPLKPQSDSPATTHSTITAFQTHSPVILKDQPISKSIETSPHTQQPPNEDRQKKDLLLLKLKALDGQKAAPGSQPVASTSEPKNTAPPPTESKPPAAEDERKKQLLLAKLMAMDTAEQPAKPPPQPAKLTKISSANRSNISLASWPESIENLHNGKPAFPDSRQSSGKKPDLPKDDGYRPTFGRRAPGVNKPSNGMIFGGELEGSLTTVKPAAALSVKKEYPWENKVELERGAPSVDQGGLGKPLLPLRSRPSPQPMRTLPADHSIISEPDDLEEVIL